MTVSQRVVRYLFATEAEAYSLASHCRDLAIDLGISDYHASLFSSAVSEIVINAVRYGKGGQMSLAKTPNGKGIMITVEDTGTGIQNISQAMQDGYSTFKEPSLGLGLGVAKRCSDEMVINKSEQTGTSITLVKYLPVPEEDVSIYGVSYPALNESSNGNRYFVRQSHGETSFVALIDSHNLPDDDQDRGRGTANYILEQVSLLADEPFIVILDSLLRSSQGRIFSTSTLKLALVRVTPDHIEYVTLNTPPIHWLQYESKPQVINLESSDGGILVTKIARPRSFVLLRHSAGVASSNLPYVDWQKLSSYHAANTVFNNCALVERDATVIVIRGNSNESKC